MTNTDASVLGATASGKAIVWVFRAPPDFLDLPGWPAQPSASACLPDWSRAAAAIAAKPVPARPTQALTGSSITLAAVRAVTKENRLAKEELIEFGGVVSEALPDNRYRVTLENGVEIWAYASGKMQKHRIRILAGDRVTLEMSPYDLTKGRINFRHKS